MKANFTIKRNDYNKIFDNAIEQFETASLLSANSKFGIATSHLILGIEELMKYQVIMLLMVNRLSFENDILPAKGKSVFNDHIFKHSLAIEFQESICPKSFNEFFRSLNDSKGNLEIARDSLKNRFESWGFIFQLFGPDWIIPIEKRKEFFHLMKIANNEKNAGFYTSYQNGKIVSPDKFTESDYIKILFFTNIILKQTAFMKSVDLTDEEIFEWQKNNHS